MLDPQEFRLNVIRPTLQASGLWSPAAENLLLGTALVESGLVHLVQLLGGPARGPYQQEKKNYVWVWDGWMATRVSYRETALSFASPRRVDNRPPHDELVGNLYFATIMARINYRRIPEALPAADDIDGLTRYHKVYWNTMAGATKVEKSRKQFANAVASWIA